MSRHIDVSILIVHATDVEVLRQTLRGIRSAAPKLSYEIIVVDNNVAAGLFNIIRKEFPEVTYIPMERNVGFGAGMNVGFSQAAGKYILIFNPDIILRPGSLEELYRYMEANAEVGVVGPRLENPDGSLQYSCFRLPDTIFPLIRRTPLGRMKWAQKRVNAYLMKDVSHEQTMPVDSLLGGAMFCRRSALEDVGLFDEQFFLYYEDNDLCRRFWEKGYPVIYHPRSQMIHYHRRATADGGFLSQVLAPITWIQIASFLKYMRKYRGKDNPRLNYGLSATTTGDGNIERADTRA